MGGLGSPIVVGGSAVVEGKLGDDADAVSDANKDEIEEELLRPCSVSANIKKHDPRRHENDRWRAEGGRRKAEGGRRREGGGRRAEGGGRRAEGGGRRAEGGGRREEGGGRKEWGERET